MKSLGAHARKSRRIRSGVWTLILLSSIAALWVANRLIPARSESPISAISAPHPSPKAVSSDKVRSVIDGDTVLLDSGAFVRLKGINAPEKDQTGYKESGEALRALVEGRTVSLEYEPGADRTDRYDRLLAILSTDLCSDVNGALIQSGWAWIYRPEKDPAKFKSYLSAQQEAIRLGKGIWTKLQDVEGPFYGSMDSLIFHQSDCRHGRRLSTKNQRTFERLRDAFWHGYSPCRTCFAHPLEGR